MRIVLDTTILVRANDSSTGLARQLLLTLLNAGHTLVVSRDIPHEAAKTLRYPRLRKFHSLTESGVYQYIAFLSDIADIVSLDPCLIVPIQDANDIAVAQTAILGGADILCTTDEDFYDAATVQFLERYGVKVMNDIDLIRRLRN